MLRLLRAGYPAAAGEVAVTDEVAADCGCASAGELTLDGRTWTVVGLVENPHDLHAEFVLVAPAEADPPESVTVLSRDHRPGSVRGVRASTAPAIATREGDATGRRRDVRVRILAVLACSLVCFIAAAGSSRWPSAGCASSACSPRSGRPHDTSGWCCWPTAPWSASPPPVVGAVAAAPVVDRRDRPGWRRPRGTASTGSDLPWWLIAACLLLAVVTATAAAWWPARAAARVPITLALSARPPRPTPARRSAVAAAVLLVLGIGPLRLAQRSTAAARDTLEITDVALIVAGTLAIGFALLFVAPLAIRVLAAAGARLPVACPAGPA